MKSNYLNIGIWTFALFFLHACTPKEVRQIPLEDFFKNSEKTSYSISPDGKYFSYMAPYQNRLNIYIQEVGQGYCDTDHQRNRTGYCRIFLGK